MDARSPNKKKDFRQCSVGYGCGKWKPITEFYFHRRDKNERKTICKECGYKYSEQWAKTNKDRVNERQRNRKHGITNTEWQILFKAQGECCAICQSNTPNTKRFWNIDHDHETGKIRGILCHHCNIALGFFEKRIIPMLDKIDQYRKRGI
jgi:hypothetical protein